MSALNWIADNATVISLVATLALVAVTAAYVYFTKKMVDSMLRQLSLASNPVIGIRLGAMRISKVFGPSRRNLNINLSFVNVGNAPAIEVLVDSEVHLQYSNIKGEKIIPARFEPESLPFIRPGEEIPAGPSDPSFGNTCLAHIFDDFRECHRLNLHRIETDPTKEAYNASRLRAYVYYRNNLNQYFESVYETYLYLEEIPEDDQTAELKQIFVPRPRFEARPILKQKMDRDIITRRPKRDLCGW